jgi:hypothetical protein
MKPKAVPIEEEPVDVDDILDEVQYHRNLIPNDCAKLLGMTRLSEDEQQKVHTLTDHVRLQTFIEVDDSFVLLASGGRASKNSPRSATSYVSAKLVESLLKVATRSTTVRAVAFFCGEHRQDEFSTARAMIITLLLQLMDQHREFELRLLRECQDTILDLKLDELCDLFERFATSLPPEAVLFIVVDGISFFEWPASRLSGTEIVLERLLDLGRMKSENLAKIKVLCTTPNRCLHLNKLFGQYEMLTTRSNVSSRGRLGDHHWRSSGVGARVAALSDGEA